MISVLVITALVAMAVFGLIWLLDAFVLRPRGARTAKKILDERAGAEAAALSERVKQDMAAIRNHNSANFPPSQGSG